MIEDAIKAAGGPSELGRRLGVSHSTVIDWRRAQRVPAKRVKAFAAATGLAPHVLRPDIFDAPRRGKSR